MRYPGPVSVFARDRCAPGHPVAPPVPATGPAQFDQVVFAGGGNRCFWQAGFWSALAPALARPPAQVAAVSAGAAMACALFSGTFERGFARHKQAVGRNARNLYAHNLLKAQPVFPHGQMYRAALLSSLDAQALDRLHRGPDITILIARAPRWASARVALLLGAISLGVDALNGQAVNAASARRLGFSPWCRTVRDCHTAEELADLIIASSCVPPLTPQARHGGAALLDGGLVGNVPTAFLGSGQPARGRTLVLLTRQFRKLPHVAGHTYVQPSAPIPVGTWDYTSPARLQAAFDLGSRDGDAFCATLQHRSQPLWRHHDPAAIPQRPR